MKQQHNNDNDIKGKHTHTHMYIEHMFSFYSLVLREDVKQIL